MISLTNNLEEQKSDNKNDKIMSRKEVMEYVGISPTTLYRWCEDGILRYSKVSPKGRKKLFRKVDVDNMIDNYSSDNISSSTT